MRRIVAGDIIDVQDSSGVWWLSIVVACEEHPQRSQKLVEVHYFGWSTDYDEILSADSDRIAPARKYSRNSECCYCCCYNCMRRVLLFGGGLQWTCVAVLCAVCAAL